MIAGVALPTDEPLLGRDLRRLRIAAQLVEHAAGVCESTEMNLQEYKRRLLDLERRLSDRTIHAPEDARAQAMDSPGDAADASVAEEAESEEFAEAQLDGAVLQQVRDALRRIDDGTFGRCVVDGEPIEEKRLEAVPWTPYCLKHQEQLEAPFRPGPTL